MKKLSCLIVLISMVILSCNNDNGRNEDENTDTVKIEETVELSLKEVVFLSLDSLKITANLYHYKDEAPVIVLCHQAGYNKFEYKEIAEKLHKKGYNCLAIDQRSGGELFDMQNETNKEAVNAGKPTEYIDAEQDIISAVDYASEKYKRSVILWGSSYSAALSLHIAVENKNVSSVISFSPGDYFGDKKEALSVKIKDFKKPMFLTSSKDEAAELSEIIKDKELNEFQIQFIPQNEGKHGSKALWEEHENNEEYWKAVELFLDKIK